MEINNVAYKKSRLTGKQEVEYSCPKCNCSLTTAVQDITKGDQCPDCSAQFTFSRSAKLSVKEKILSERAAEEAALLKTKEKHEEKKQLKEEKTKEKSEKARDKLLAKENKGKELGGPYVRASLSPEEKVLYVGEIHWKIFIWPILAIFIGSISVLIALQVGAITIPAIILFSALASFLIAYITKLSSEFAVTDRKVVVKQGFISRQTAELKLSKIDSLQVKQGLIDRLLNCGVVVVSVATEKVKIRNLANPLGFKKAVDEVLPN